MELVGDDAQAAIECVNRGIDSRLTAFTRSTFEWRVHNLRGQHFSLADWEGLVEADPTEQCIATKLHCQIHPDEMEILLRRLNDLEDEGDENAGSLADSIVYVEYEVEVM